jgi:hypothetical protein
LLLLRSSSADQRQIPSPSVSGPTGGGDRCQSLAGSEAFAICEFIL